MPKDIFEFTKTEETAYAQPITVIDGWDWNMKEHIRIAMLYKNSQFSEGNDKISRDDKPFKNIVRPILNLQYRTEGFDVKDIILYVDDQESYYKSFLVKKYHDRWAQKNKIDTFIDDVNESIVDFGGSLIRDENKKRPAIVPLSTLAFADQTNMLTGPLGIKHFYDPAELQGFASQGWGDKKNGATITIEEAIILSKSNQVPDAKTGKENKTPGKYIECYEVHGMLPESWYVKGGSPDKYVRQMHILMFYKDEKGDRQGLTLFAGRAPEGLFKVALRDKIQGRALGFGGVEEIVDPQIWTNYNEIVKKGLLDGATKILLKTTDSTLKAKHPKGLKELDNLELLEIEDGKDIGQVNTTPVNFALFEKASSDWDENARTIGAATDAVLGENPASGTPFKLQDVIIQQGLGLHEYRQGRYASFIGDEVYPDWILPQICHDLTNGAKFLEELSLKELQYVADALVECQINDIIKDKILKGQEIVPSDIENLKVSIRKQFMKKGNKHFLEILKGEMDDAPLAIHVSVAGKQKDLAKMTDKVVNIIRQVIAAPGILQIPGMADLFNQIIEYSGLNPVDFSILISPPKSALPPAPVAQPPVIPTPAPAPVQ